MKSKDKAPSGSKHQADPFPRTSESGGRHRSPNARHNRRRPFITPVLAGSRQFGTEILSQPFRFSCLRFSDLSLFNVFFFCTLFVIFTDIILPLQPQLSIAMKHSPCLYSQFLRPLLAHKSTCVGKFRRAGIKLVAECGNSLRTGNMSNQTPRKLALTST